MERIAGPGNVNNQFSEGNPAIGQQATMVTAKWTNDVQEEICNVIEEAGIALDGEAQNQLYQAIVSLVAGVVGDGSGAVPTTRLVSAAGLATGGGDLAADRTITVPKASAAEVAAGTNDTKAVTPLALQGGVGGSLMAGVGYKTIFGLIFQWGTYSVGANSSATVTFPSAFPSMCVYANVSGGRLDYGAQDNNPVVSGVSSSALTVFNATDGSGVTGKFFALGF
ncbi:gp53-like domain-containing protein [Sphingopyxis granuli]|uniref:gp53-like domain-containing protein n=1 Tax=Sphingopyxis granuli TaxID=267128 RepID=UPI001BAFB956|nr:hypothetical protein [Sphingopyxis granuli]QUM72172.1 hypothetical protein ICN83_18070 [Sphingopyxis granuli]